MPDTVFEFEVEPCLARTARETPLHAANTISETKQKMCVVCHAVFETASDVFSHVEAVHIAAWQV